MKVFLMIVSFLVFSFLGAEEPQTPAQDQNNNAEAATAEAPAETAQEAAPAENAQETAPVETAQEAAPAENAPEAAPAQETAPAEKPVAEEPKVQEPAKTAQGSDDEQGYNLKLRALEEKIDTLKDKIFKSKQRLAILQETVLGGTVGGSTVTIIHRNEVGDLFKLVSAVYYFDDKPIFKKVDLPEELEEKEFQVYDSAVVPGPHRVSVYYVYEGKGYGFFSYLKAYSLKVSADHSFTLEEGDIVEVEVSAIDKGGMYDFEHRIGVQFEVSKNTFENRDSAQEE
jgi:Predicted membrane protein